MIQTSVLLTSLLASLAYASSTPDPVSVKLDAFRKEGDYLGPIDLLRAEMAKGDEKRSQWGQILAFQYSYVGDIANANEAFAQAPGVPPGHDPSEQTENQFLSAIQVEPAVSAVCSLALKHQVVIINESHHHPEDRAFGRRILRCFKSAGFDKVAIEAVNESTEAVNSRGRVSYHDTGYYAVEPQMAGLIGDALDLGMKVIHYDTAKSCDGCSIEDQIDQREEGEADNLVSEVFSKDPKSKLLIWVGYSHAYKRQLKSDPRSRWMAARLWQKTGIEPYSVEQLSDQQERNAGQPAFTSINKKIIGNAPVFVELAKHWDEIPEFYKEFLRKTVQKGRPAIDAVIVHRAHAAGDGRELWFNAPTDRILKGQVTCSSCGAGSKLFQVFPVNTDLNDVTPLDQALILDGRVTIVLPARHYAVRMWDGSRVVYSGQLFLDRNFSLSF